MLSKYIIENTIKMEYQKYSGEFEKTDLVTNLKYFHTKTKEFYIKKYCKNSNLLIDIGSGRGSDARHWMSINIKFVIGIEPSKESIERAIKNYFRYKRELKIDTKIMYLNGIGNKLWNNGDASLSEKDVQKFKYFFGTKNIKADNINMFWTIHYMMNTREDFNNLIININNHTLKNSTIIIHCMDGKKIDDMIKKNGGNLIVKHNEFEILRIDPLYDFKNKNLPIFGNQISVKLAGTYGLQKGIEENLVFIDFLIESMKKYSFKLVEKTPYLDIKIPERKIITNYEEQVSNLYVALVFKKKDH